MSQKLEHWVKKTTVGSFTLLVTKRVPVQYNDGKKRGDLHFDQELSGEPAVS